MGNLSIPQCVQRLQRALHAKAKAEPSYRVVWTMLQRYRVAMVRAEREQLFGNVEVDETLAGGLGHGGKRGRGKGYNDLYKHGYIHQQTVFSESGDPAHVAMPGVHRIASLLKRWILGTHQGSITSEHLQSYKKITPTCAPLACPDNDTVCGFMSNQSLHPVDHRSHSLRTSGGASSVHCQGQSSDNTLAFSEHSASMFLCDSGAAWDTKTESGQAARDVKKEHDFLQDALVPGVNYFVRCVSLYPLASISWKIVR